MDLNKELKHVEKNRVLSKNEKMVLGCELEVEEILDWKDIEPQLHNWGDEDQNFDPFKLIDITQDERIKKMILKEGKGNIAPSSAIVFFHYDIYSEMDLTTPFDSTILKSRLPLKIRLGKNSVNNCLELAISTMKKGEKSQFDIHPDFAIGLNGTASQIPPGVWILIVIDLVDFIQVSDNEAHDLENIFSLCFAKCEILNKEGNNFFINKHTKSALDNYKSARDLLFTASPKTNNEKKKKLELYIKLCQNIMICLNKNGQQKLCCSIAKEVFQNCYEEANANPKLHYNYAKALYSLHEYDLALKHIKRALALEPANFEISRLMKELELKKLEYKNKEKSFFKKSFMGLENKNSKQEFIAEKSDTEKNYKGKFRKV